MTRRELMRRHYAGAAARSRYLARQDSGLSPLESAVVARWCPGGARVLVLGCGAGREAIPLARLGHRVVAIDTDHSLLQAADSRLPSVPFIRSSAEALPFSAQCFRAVVAFSQLLGQLDASARVEMLAEARRVLDGAGVCIVTAHDRARTLLLARDRAIEVEELSEGDVRLLEGSEPVVYHYFERAELLHALAGAGLRVVWCGHGDELGDRQRSNVLVAVAQRA